MDETFIFQRKEKPNVDVQGLGGRTSTQEAELPTMSTPNENNSISDKERSTFNEKRWLQTTIAKLEEAGITPTKTTVAFKGLRVSGTGVSYVVQPTLWTAFASPFGVIRRLIRPSQKPPRRNILHHLDGLVNAGEMLLVLGRPNAGCSTLLKTITGQVNGFDVESEGVTEVSYNGLPQDVMMKHFRGEVIYSPENDEHFPHLTVDQTLSFAAACRTPSIKTGRKCRDQHIKDFTKAAMTASGVSHVADFKVGSETVKGISPGERKRVSIAETMLSRASVVGWDQSTRCLDSTSALAFIKSLRLVADLVKVTHMVTMYSVPENIYNLFDKVTVLYEGRQIFFGPVTEAKRYFQDMGYECPPRQTSADFLTSVTDPAERRARPGMADRVPRTSEDFEMHWKQSADYRQLQNAITRYKHDCHSRRDEASTTSDAWRGIGFAITMGRQIQLTTKRAFQMTGNDSSATVVYLVIHFILALILGSAFYDTPPTAEAFFSKGSLLFICALRSVLTAISEIDELYAKRPIIEKHFAFGYYHPAVEAVAGYLADLPIRLISSILFNVTVYFMAGLRREPGAFFLFFFTTFILSLVMSTMFRAIAANTKSPGQAMMAASVLLTGFVMYSGFQIREPQMHIWFSWIRWLSPIFYAFEILIANEAHEVQLTCTTFIPPFEAIGDSWICTAVGAVAGRAHVDGDTHIDFSFGYRWDNVPRDCGVLVGFFIFFLVLYLISTEKHASKMRIINLPPLFVVSRKPKDSVISEAPEPAPTNNLKNSCLSPGATLAWRDLGCTVSGAHSQERALLQNIDGWVAPGSLTAVLGPNGSGKTVLLQTLAGRLTTGVSTGKISLDRECTGPHQQRQVGYVDQGDSHLETATVRETLQFSALLRQAQSTPKSEKLAFVEDLIVSLGMEDFADHIVGRVGMGLDIRQRKLLGIGVEFAAKSRVLILDELTTGLDSTNALGVLKLLRHLTDAGQAVICSVNQPSASIFELFDSVMCLGHGGRMMYFGEAGQRGEKVVGWFERNGARNCGVEENQADFVLDVSADAVKWSHIWAESEQRKGIRAYLDRLMEPSSSPQLMSATKQNLSMAYPGTLTQFSLVLKRLFTHYMRMPAYIIGKIVPSLICGVFIGFSFYGADQSFAGMQGVLFAVFMVLTLFPGQASQLQPNFLALRAFFEQHARFSQAYSWQVLLSAWVLVEITVQILQGICLYASFYYAVIGIQASDRQGLVLLFCVQLLIYATSFGLVVIAALPSTQIASPVVSLLVFMMLVFCGVLQPLPAMPEFWRFMYRLSPFNYWISGIASTQLHGRSVTCSVPETSIFDPPNGMTCTEYFSTGDARSVVLQNPNDSTACRACPIRVADEFLATSGIFWEDRWRNFGIFWVFIAFNLVVGFFLYWLFRVSSFRAWFRRSWRYTR